MKTHFDLNLSKKIVHLLMMASVVLALGISPSFGQVLEDHAQEVKQLTSDDCQEYGALKIDPARYSSQRSIPEFPGEAAVSAPPVKITAEKLNTIDAEGVESESIQCTSNGFQHAPAGLSASVQGRIRTAEGRAISGVFITIFNATTGGSKFTVSNSFGYYKLTELPAAEFYVMSVGHKRHLFLDASRSFTLEKDMYGIDFTASALD